MAAPPASDNRETGAEGNLSAGTIGPMIQQGDIENALPVVDLSWRAHFRRHQERFGKLDPAVRRRLVLDWVIMAVFMLLALAAPLVLLVYLRGHQMAWVMDAALCFYVFLFLFLHFRQWGYADFFRVTYGLVVAYIAAGVIGPRTAAFVMHLGTVWASGYLGCSLAVNRLHHGTNKPAIHCLPPPSSWITGGLVVSVLWTAVMAAIVYGCHLTEPLAIVLFISYLSWFHAVVYLYGYFLSGISASFGCMDGVFVKGDLVMKLLA